MGSRKTDRQVERDVVSESVNLLSYYTRFSMELKPQKCSFDVEYSRRKGSNNVLEEALRL